MDEIWKKSVSTLFFIFDEHFTTFQTESYKLKYALIDPIFVASKSALRSGDIITNEGLPRCDYC